jgi:hypothetical protein
MMCLGRRLALRLVDDFFDPRQVSVCGIREKTNIVVRVGSQDLRDRAQLRGKIRMGQEKSHGKNSSAL